VRNALWGNGILFRNSRSIDLKTYIRNVPRKGRGVFAVSEIGSGELIFTNSVVEIPVSQVAAIRDTVLSLYVFDWPGPRQNKKSVKWSRCCVVLGEGMLINHSEAPNSCWEIDKESRTVSFFANRRIEKDEEITHNYHWAVELTSKFIE